MDTKEYNKIQTISLSFLALMGLGVLLHMTKAFMVPFIFAIILSFMFIPLITKLEYYKIPGFLSNLIVLLGIFLIVTLLFTMFYSAILSVKDKIPLYSERYTKIAGSIKNFMAAYIPIDLLQKYKNVTIDELLSLISPSSIINTINHSIGSFISFMSQMTLFTLFLMFILSIRKSLIRKIFLFVDSIDDHSTDYASIIKNITRQIQHYLLYKTLISIGTGLIFGMAAFLMGLDFPIIWGFLAFIFNYIPSIGPIIATVPPLAIAFVQFESLFWTILTSILLATVQLLSGSIIEPMLMGDRLNLNIIVILLSLFLWGLIWGIAGMIIAVPIMAALNIICLNIPQYKTISLFLSK